MTEQNLSDDELAEADRRAYRARFIWGPAFALYGFVVAVGLFFAIHIGLLPAAWGKGKSPLVLLAATLLLASPAIIFLARRYRVPKAARRGGVQRKLVDDHQRRGRIAMWRVTILVPLMAVMAIGMDIHKGGRFNLPSDLYLPFDLTLIALLGSFGILRGPAASDELTQALRANAAKLGFVIAIAGLCAVYALMFYRPDWARLAVPCVVALSIVSSAIHYLIADWRAGQEG